MAWLVKLIYSEKVTEFNEISILILMLQGNVKTKMESLSYFVAFSENLNCSQKTYFTFYEKRGSPLD